MALSPDPIAADISPRAMSSAGASLSSPDSFVRGAQQDGTRWWTRPPTTIVVSAFLFTYVGAVPASVWLATALGLEALGVWFRRRLAAGDMRFRLPIIANIFATSVCWIAHALMLWRVGGDVPHIAALMDLFTVSLYAVTGSHQDRRLMLVLLVPPVATLAALLVSFLWSHAPPIMAVFGSLATLGACAMLVMNGLALHRSDRNLSQAKAKLEGLFADLEANREFLEEVSDLAQVGGWQLDIRTGQMTMSTTARRLYEIDEDAELSVDDVMKRYPTEYEGPARAALEDAVTRGGGWDFEIPVVTHRGRTIWVRVVGRAMMSEGKPVRLVGAVQDITDRRRTQKELKELAEAAKVASQAKDGFLTNMSHEIRTPLNGIVGLAAAMVRTKLDARQREMIQLIHDSGETLERILSDLLDLSKIESGKVELRLESFNLRGAVETAAYLMGARADEKGLGFKIIHSAPADGQFVGDAVRIRQIVSNLASNAVKFTEAGEVTVEVDAVDAVKEGAPTIVRIRISDTGIGFDHDVASRLFQRFEQGDGSITRRFGGTGLGLAISQALASQMGGQIETWSEPGRGSVFTLTLPLQRAVADGAPNGDATPDGDAASRALSQPSFDQAEDGRPVSVLLAEDHPVNQRAFMLMLEALGASVTLAANGQEAVQVFSEEPFDLVLMDMQMPVMDGLAATRAIRELERDRHLVRSPIAMVSANAMNDHIQMALDAGCDFHLSKPITPDRLTQGIVRALAMRAAALAATCSES